MANVIVDGTSEFKASIVNKLISAISDTLGVAVAACQILGTITTPYAVNYCGFETTVTDNGVGHYSVDFANAFSDSPCVVMSATNAAAGCAIASLASVTSTGVQVKAYTHAGAAQEASVYILAIGSR